MDLQQTLNDFFKGEAKVLSTTVEHVVLVSSPEKVRDSFSEEAKKEIEAIKSSLQKNLPLYHVDDLSFRGTFALFTTRTGEYADLMCMRKNPSLLKPAVLSTAGIFKTIDNVLLFDKRSSTMSTYPNCYHIIGGIMEPEKDDTPLETAIREGCEEIGLKADELDSGLARVISINLEPRTGYYQASYFIPLLLALDEIKKRTGDGEGEKMYVENSETALESFLLDYWEQFVPTGLALSLVYGSKEFGDAWAEDILVNAKGKRFANPK